MTGGKLHRKAMISWPARAARHNEGNLGRKAMKSWPAWATHLNGGNLGKKAMKSWTACHECGQVKQKANDNWVAYGALAPRTGRVTRNGGK